jgi:hypothetical protein
LVQPNNDRSVVFDVFTKPTPSHTLAITPGDLEVEIDVDPWDAAVALLARMKAPA